MVCMVCTLTCKMTRRRSEKYEIRMSIIVSYTHIDIKDCMFTYSHEINICKNGMMRKQYREEIPYNYE